MKKCGKDLGIAVRLIEAGAELHGFGAIADGFVLINKLFSQYNETLHPLADEGAGDGGAEEIVGLVDRPGAEHGEDEVAHELFAQIVYVALGGAGVYRLLIEAGEFFRLPEVGGEADYFAAVLFDEPAYDYRGVEAAGVREDDLVRFLGH